MRWKRKEIIIVVGILLLTILLVFLDRIKKSKEKEEIGEEPIIEVVQGSKSPYITITVTGELLVDELKLKIPVGYSYGDILKYIQKYSNDYSVLQPSLQTRFYEDTTIQIASVDTYREIKDTSYGVISIHTATKEELISLYGIGEKRAMKIIEYRKTKRIESFAELKKILGVSDEIIQRIQEQAIL